MAATGLMMASTPRRNDFHDHVIARQTNHHLDKLRSYLPTLSDAGATQSDTGSMKKRPKHEDKIHSAFNRLKPKSKPTKALSLDIQGSSSPLARTPSLQSHVAQNSSRASGTCASCGSSQGTSVPYNGYDPLWKPMNDHNAFVSHSIAYDDGHRLPEKKGMVKRSMSAVSDHSRSGHSPNGIQSPLNASIISGQRLAEWSELSRFDFDGRQEVRKKSNLRLDDDQSRTSSSGKSQLEAQTTGSSAFNDALTLFGEPPYVQTELQVPTDRSPLIEFDKPSFTAARNSFDNVAATENGNNSRNSVKVRFPSGGQGRTTVACSDERGREASQTAHGGAHGDGDSAPQRQNSVLKSSDGKKKKWFPSLRVKIPENDEGSASPKLNIKKLTAAQERELEEVLELAGSFGRLGNHSIVPSTPRTPGASSKESKESLNGSSESPSTHFRFNFFKARKEEKKTFAEELASDLTDPSSLLTPEALDAYEKLVAKSGNEEEEAGTKTRPAKQLTRQAHRLSLRKKLLQRVHPQRSSLSESDKGGPVLDGTLKKNPSNSELRISRLMRFGSTGEAVKNHKALTCEDDVFAWFHKSPLNVATPETRARPKSLVSDASTESRNSAFPLKMPPESPVIQLPPRDGRDSCMARSVQSTRRTPPPLPTNDVSPPAIPPRVPRRPVITNTKSKQRQQHPLPASTTDKQRSYSEGLASPSLRLDVYDIPRRTIRSVAAEGRSLRSSASDSPTGLKPSNSMHGSNDSVFDHISRSPLPVDPKAYHGTGSLRQYRSLSVKNVKINAKELGISNKDDPFWVKTVSLDLSESLSESDLLREVLAPIPGRYETSDCISYEDLMEFALDGPQNQAGTNNADFAVCDEVRVMRKMFPNVAISDCMAALVETGWNLLNAVKLIKLKQLIGAGLGTKDECKQALMARNWDVDEAAHFLLSPPM